MTGSETKTTAQKQADALAKMRKKLSVSLTAKGLIAKASQLVVPTSPQLQSAGADEVGVEDDWYSLEINAETKADRVLTSLPPVGSSWIELYPVGGFPLENKCYNGGKISKAERRWLRKINQAREALLSGPQPAFFDPKHPSFHWFDDNPKLDCRLWNEHAVNRVLWNSREVVEELVKVKRHNWNQRYVSMLGQAIVLALKADYFQPLANERVAWLDWIALHTEQALAYWDRFWNKEGGFSFSVSIATPTPEYMERYAEHDVDIETDLRRAESLIDSIDPEIRVVEYDGDPDTKHTELPLPEYTTTAEREAVFRSWEAQADKLAYCCMSSFAADDIEVWMPMLIQVTPPIVVPALTPAEEAEIIGEELVVPTPVTGILPVTVKRKIDPAKKLMQALLRKRAALDAKFGR